MSLSNKKIVVTGSASGIGAASCRFLRAQGAWVVGLDRTPRTDNVDLFAPLDLLDGASITAALAALPEAIDGLCNIAGVPPAAGRARVLKTNFFALCALTERLADRFSAGASIVNIASIAGFGWREDMARIKAGLALAPDISLEDIDAFCDAHEIDDVFSYLFAKEMLIVWTRKIHDLWRARGVRINTISPGPAETPILKDFMAAFGERARNDVAAVGRPGTPEDIAPVIAFLCSEQSAWITGANIPVDGGLEAIALKRAFDF